MRENIPVLNGSEPMSPETKCVNCSGTMEYQEYRGDIFWYKCNQCQILEGSEGTIDMSKMKKPLTDDEIILHRKKWEV